MNIRLKDGTMKSVDDNITALDLARVLSNSLPKKAVVAEVNGKLVDLSHKLQENDEVSILTVDDEKSLEVLRHSTAHIMAQAVKRLFKDAKCAIGPTIENGFYYDFDLEHPFVAEDLVKIEKEMNKIIKENIKIERLDVTREEALKLMNERNESYKIELIKDLPEGENIYLYRQGEYVDLCR